MHDCWFGYGATYFVISDRENNAAGYNDRQAYRKSRNISHKKKEKKNTAYFTTGRIRNIGSSQQGKQSFQPSGQLIL